MERSQPDPQHSSKREYHFHKLKSYCREHWCRQRGSVSIGIAEGVDWSSIEMTWSGYSSSYQGEVFQTSIPFQFLSDGIEYRVILDYCTQLSTRKDVFLPGEFHF